MKFCILSTSYPKWMEKENEFVQGKFVHDMAKYLVRAGIEVHVVTHHGDKTPKKDIRDGVIVHRFRYFPKKYETLTKGAGIPENIKKLHNLIQVPFYFLALFLCACRIVIKHKVDIINAHWAFPTGYIGLMIKFFLSKKLVTTIYGAELFPLLEGRMTYITPFLRDAIKKSDVAAGISDATISAARRLSGRSDIEMIPDGIDVHYYVPGNRREDLLRKYDCSGAKVIFFTGRMVERKGHRYVLEAMRRVINKIPNAKLLLGGDGPLMNDLLRRRDILGLSEYVIMPGFFPEHELTALLQSVDLYVLPSCIDKNGDTEGSATAAFEAMSCGKAALISNVGGNKGSIVDGVGAMYFRPGDPDDLAEKIITLLGDEAYLAAIAGLARDYVVKNFSWEATIDRYLKLLDKS